MIYDYKNHIRYTDIKIYIIMNNQLLEKLRKRQQASGIIIENQPVKHQESPDKKPEPKQSKQEYQANRNRVKALFQQKSGGTHKVQQPVKKQEIKGNSEGFANARKLLEQGLEKPSSSGLPNLPSPPLPSSNIFDLPPPPLPPSNIFDLPPPPPPPTGIFDLPPPSPPPSNILDLPPPPPPPSLDLLPPPNILPPPPLPTVNQTIQTSQANNKFSKDTITIDLPPPPPPLPTIVEPDLPKKQQSPKKQQKVLLKQHIKQPEPVHKKEDQFFVISSPNKNKPVLQQHQHKVQHKISPHPEIGHKKTQDKKILQIQKVPSPQKKKQQQGKIFEVKTKPTTQQKTQKIEKKNKKNSISTEFFGRDVAGFIKKQFVRQSDILNTIGTKVQKKTYNFNFPSIQNKLRDIEQIQTLYADGANLDVVSCYMQKNINAAKKHSEARQQFINVLKNYNWVADVHRYKQIKQSAECLPKDFKYRQLNFVQVKNALNRCNNIIKSLISCENYEACSEIKKLKQEVDKMINIYSKDPDGNEYLFDEIEKKIQKIKEIKI